MASRERHRPRADPALAVPVSSQEDNLMNANTLQKQEGFVLIVVALMLILLVGFLAFAVDIGILYSARTSAQDVADAAALAGAYTFINDTKSPQPATASNNAVQVAVNNSILGQAVAAGDVNVSVDVPNQGSQRVCSCLRIRTLPWLLACQPPPLRCHRSPRRRNI